MATRSATTTRRAAKPAPEPEVVEDEFEDMEDGEADEPEAEADELEELDEDEPAEAPAAKAKSTKAKPAKAAAPKRPTIEFGSPWLAAYITENTDETYDSRAIRMLLRKLAKDGKLEREVGVTRDRYQFTGPEDPTVVAVLAMVKSGAAKELKQAGLQAVKDKAAATKAAAKKAKAETAEAEADEMDEDDDVEEAPAPKARRTAAKTAAPAKATPATRRRTAQK